MDIEYYPQIRNFWDFEKNTIDPQSVSPGSNISAFWKCRKCGYEWKSTINARKSRTDQCPCCDRNQVVIKGINDVFTLVKDLDSEYDFNANKDRPYDIYKENVTSSKEATWHCGICGRTWNASIKSRVKKTGDGYVIKPCPHRNTTSRKQEDIPSVADCPDLMKFWDNEKNDVKPDKVSSASGDIYNWKCMNCGYEWTTSPRSRMRRSGQCDCCDRNQVHMKGVNDLFTLIPEARLSYDFEKNKNIDIYSLAIKDKKTPVAWKCELCGKEWTAPLAYRVAGTAGNYRLKKCQRCSGISQRKTVSSSSALMKFWDADRNTGLDPNLLSIHSTDTAHWKCKRCGFTFKSQINSRTVADGKCPCCDSGLGVSPGYNDVMTLFPEFSNIYDPADNPDVDIRTQSPFSKVHISCRCKTCGYTWGTNINRRFSRNEDGELTDNGCPACKGLVRTQTYAKQYPELLELYDEKANGKPLSAVTGSREDTRAIYMWKCKTCGNSFSSTLRTMIDGLSSSSGGCPYCSKVILTRETSFAGIHPELMDEYSDENILDPFGVFPSSDEDAIWECRMDPGHRWTAKFRTRHNGLGLCPVCNHTRPVKGYNTFADVYPQYVDMFAENNTIRLDEILDTTSEWTHWNCPVCGGEYGAYTNEVAAGTNVCPYCEKGRVLPGFNSFADLHPDIARMWSKENEQKSNEVSDTWSRRVLWTCPTCHGVHSEFISDMIENPDKCPYCSGRRILPGFNSFNVKHPELMKEYDYVSNYALTEPDAFGDTCQKVLWWQCPKNKDHVYPMSPANRLFFQKRNRESCPFCKGRRRNRYYLFKH